MGMLRKTSRTREDTHKKAVHGVPTLQLTVSSRAPRHVIALHAGIGGLAMEVAQHNRFRNLSEQVLSGRHRYRHQMRHTSVTRHTWVPLLPWHCLHPVWPMHGCMMRYTKLQELNTGPT